MLLNFTKYQPHIRNKDLQHLLVFINNTEARYVDNQIGTKTNTKEKPNKNMGYSNKSNLITALWTFFLKSDKQN